MVVWGTANMRTQGDDIAEVLALLGVRPVWHEHSGRVEGLEVIPLAELGRPRVDVTVRISGFFRDAFPDVVDLLDDAVRLVGELDEPPDDNPIRSVGLGDARVFGPAPGAYGSGMYQLIEGRAWRTKADLAEVYLAWSGFAYRRGSAGVAEPGQVRRRFAAIDVALKNQDNREHDIFDSDDYFQDHGGMVATVEALTGVRPGRGSATRPIPPGRRCDRWPRRPRASCAPACSTRNGSRRCASTGTRAPSRWPPPSTTSSGTTPPPGVVEDWMYERVTQAYVSDPVMRDFFERSNPWALRSVCERLLEADERELWDATDEARAALRDGLLAAEGMEERRT